VNHSPAQIVRRLLIGLGLGSDVDAGGQPEGEWPVYDNDEPDRPDNTVTLFDYDGPDEGSTQPDGEMQGLDALQIRVRCKTKIAGWRKAYEIKQAIEKSPLVGGQAYNVNVGIETTWYKIHCFSRISNVIPLGKETPTSTRKIFVVNCLVDVIMCCEDEDCQDVGTGS
jgi:hypothetical protein